MYKRQGQGVPGSPLSAIVVARSAEVSVVGNVIDTAQDGGIEVTAALDGASLVPTRYVTVAGNTISNGLGVVTGLTIGSTRPDLNGETSDVTVTGNTITTSGVSTPQIALYAGKRIGIIGNTFVMLAVPGTASSLYLTGATETGATATYTDDVLVKANTFYGTNSGGAYTPVEIGVLAAAAIIRADFMLNRLIMPGTAFSLDAAQTNPNLHATLQPSSGLTTVAVDATAGLTTAALSALGALTAAFPGGGGLIVSGTTPDAPATGSAYMTFQTGGSNRYYLGMSANGGTGNFDLYNNIGAVNAFSIDKTTSLVTLGAALKVTTGFGCNSKAAQTAFASGGALNAYGAGANGFDTAGNASALYAMVVAIRASLVACGIMS